MNPMITELQAAQAARQATAQALRDARYNALVIRAAVERDIITSAGGVKALGSNEAERERAMTLSIIEVQAWQQAQAILNEAEDADRIARDRLEVARAVIALEVADLNAQSK